MTHYINEDDISKQIYESAKLLQSVSINALIVGEAGVGKKFLAKQIVSDSEIYKAKELQEDISNNFFDKSECSIIIENIEELTNIDLFNSYILNNHIRIIATSQTANLNSKLKDLFSIDLKIENLSKRPKDTIKLAHKFSLEAAQTLDLELLTSSRLITNISNNCHSLRKSIFFSYLFETIGEKEILMFLEKYFASNLEGENSYKDFLPLFEVPLLKAANAKYKSQVQVAKHLGLNRITLRKKLDIYKDEL